MRYRFLILFALINTLSKAQNKLFLCANYNDDGTYSGTYENWFLNRTGNFMYLFYQSSKPVNDTLFVLLEKNFNRRDSTYYELDHYFLVPDYSKKFAVNKYTFTKPGKYKISVYNKNGDRVAEPYYTNIEYLEDQYDELFIKDSWYYSHSKLTFYEKIIGDSLIGENNIFSVKKDDVNVLLKIFQENKKPLKSNNLFVSVYTDDKFKERISSFPYYINEKWHWTYVPVNFKQKGKFIVEVYSDNDVFINSAKIEIK